MGNDMHIRVFITFGLMLVTAASLLGCDNGDSTPTPERMNGRNILDLNVGEKWQYEFFADSEQYGFNEYEVIVETDHNGEKSFTIASVLELQESDACKPTTSSGTLHITQIDIPISYQMDISVGSG